jgi:hypothetical protein
MSSHSNLIHRLVFLTQLGKSARLGWRVSMASAFATLGTARESAGEKR